MSRTASPITPTDPPWPAAPTSALASILGPHHALDVILQGPGTQRAIDLIAGLDALAEESP